MRLFLLLLFLSSFQISSVSMVLSPSSKLREEQHHQHNPKTRDIEIDKKGDGWTALDPDSEESKISRRVSLKLLEEYSDEIFNNAEIINVDIQRVVGINYRICLRANERDFELTVSYPMHRTIRDEMTEATLTNIQGITTKFEKLLKDRDSYLCVKTFTSNENKKDQHVDAKSVYPPPSLLRTSSHNAVESPPRFKYDIGEQLPDKFDWREMYDGKCKDQIEQIYDQGTCGACYAWSTVTSLADRVCLKRAERGDPSPELLRLSVQDLIACGSRDHGSICLVSEGGASRVTRFANGCDGWMSAKAFEYAVKRGLKEETCHPYELHSDTLEDDVVVPSLGTICVAQTTENFVPVTVICDGVGEIFLRQKRSEESLLGPAAQFCSCAEKNRKVKFQGEIYDGWPVEAFAFKRKYKSKSDCTVSKPIIEEDDDRIELACTDMSDTNEDETITIRPFKDTKNREETVNLGPIDWITPDNARLMSIAGQICRCSDDGKEGEGWSRVRLNEVGRQALSGSCIRDTMKGSCEKTHHFSEVTKVPKGELMTKAAIYAGGPIVATLSVIDSLYAFEDGNGHSIYRGIVESNDAYPEHAIVLFGWGVDEVTGEKFWWARNSWGSSWPKNAKTPGIFKLSRGENRNNVESKERVFANAILDSSVEQKDTSTFDRMCESLQRSVSMTSSQQEALKCMEVTNRETSVQVRNKCKEDVMILKEISNPIAEKKKKKMCGVILEEVIFPYAVSTNLPMLVDLCIIQATFLPGYPSCVNIMRSGDDENNVGRCTLMNRCHREIRVMERGKRTRLITTLPLNRKVPLESKYCDEKNIHTDWGTRDGDNGL